MALQPLEQSGHIQLGQGFGFTGTALEVGSGREPAIPCEVKCPPLKTAAGEFDDWSLSVLTCWFHQTGTHHVGTNILWSWV